MLSSMTIQNIALIEKLTLSFGAGLHVLTGETGAGKSIVVDAIALLLGGKADKELLRQGAQKASVEGLFDIADCPAAAAWLAGHEIEIEENQVTLAREMSLSGRSPCRVEGVMVALSEYQELTSLLMDLHGQHAHQSLMDDRKHIAFLDDYGDAAYQQLLGDVRKAFALWQDARRAYERLRAESQQKQERIERIRAALKELNDAKLEPGEEDALAQERDRFRHAEKIDTHLRAAFAAVYDDARAAVAQTRQAAAALSNIASLGEAFEKLQERLDSAYYELEDIGLTIRDELNSNNADPQRQDFVHQRLDLLRRLSRKYGATTQDMLSHRDELKNNLQTFETLDERLDELNAAEHKLRTAYDEKAAALSTERAALARQFEQAMEAQLTDLNMAGTRFCVQLTAVSPTLLGTQAVQFLIAPNRGESLQPLSKTASGGELSRLMLAIKSIAAQKSLIPSMVFDEIDTGISGHTAQVVAQKMHAIAAFHQVLCVTHLQQIAAVADHHFRVEKYFDGQRTLTRLTELSLDERVDEVARMLGGDAASARGHAREMIIREDTLGATRP